MKKHLSILLLITVLFSLFGCGSTNKKSIKSNAVWEEYNEISFKDFLEEALTVGFGSQFDSFEIEIIIETGWKDAKNLNEKDVEKGYTAVTYTADMSLNGEPHAMKFYMEKNNKDVLTVQGMDTIYNGTVVDSVVKDEAQERLKLLIREI